MPILTLAWRHLFYFLADLQKPFRGCKFTSSEWTSVIEALSSCKSLLSINNIAVPNGLQSHEVSVQNVGRYQTSPWHKPQQQDNCRIMRRWNNMKMCCVDSSCVVVEYLLQRAYIPCLPAVVAQQSRVSHGSRNRRMGHYILLWPFTWQSNWIRMGEFLWAKQWDAVYRVLSGMMQWTLAIYLYS